MTVKMTVFTFLLAYFLVSFHFTWKANRQSGEEKKIFFICWFTPRGPPIVKAGQGSQGPETHHLQDTSKQLDQKWVLNSNQMLRGGAQGILPVLKQLNVVSF